MMNKFVAINKVRDASIMKRINKSEWVFHYAGYGIFAAINIASNGLYFAHTKGNKSTTHKTFMSAVASTLDTFISVQKEFLVDLLKDMKAEYNSVELMRYSHADVLHYYVVTTNLLVNFQGHFAPQALTGEPAFYPTKGEAELAATGQWKRVITLGEAINIVSKEDARTIKIIQDKLAAEYPQEITK